MKKVVLLSVLLCICYVCKAQVLFCIHAGQNIDRDTEIYYVYKDGRNLYFDGIYYAASNFVTRVRSNGMTNFENHVKYEYRDSSPYVYSSSLSTNKMDVFSREWRIVTVQGDWTVRRDRHVGNSFVALSKDKKSIIKWNEEDNSNEVVDKKEYIVVTLDDVKNGLNPQPSNHVNRDFLYE